MNNKPTIMTGRAWVINDEKGKLIDDIDTDMIFHNAYLHITELDKMAPHAFGNLDNWEDFPKKAQKDDILVLGKNFGAGSSRQQAVDCFIALGVQALLAESYGAIYKRNAINTGLPIMAKEDFASELKVESGDKLEINLETSIVKNLTKNTEVKMLDFSNVQMDIYQHNGLHEYGKSLEA